MKTTNARSALVGWSLFLLAGVVAKAKWPRLDPFLVTVIVFVAGVLIVGLLTRRAEASSGGYGIDDTGDGDSTGDGSAGDSSGGGE